MRNRVRKLLRRAWRGQAVGIGPTERLKLRRQMATAGKEESVTLSLFLDVEILEVEEELSTMATLCWAERVWMNRWRQEQQTAWKKQIFEVQTRVQV